MSWQKELNSLFNDSFFRFLFGFTVIIATSFGIVIVTSLFSPHEAPQGSAPITAGTQMSY